ncbi:MAG: hypothetical protein SP4CHLAM5_07100 [Chlamydiia bacterium]|nr:hypothetical protein [Chlamydiia bacterium]MCH9618577.1 hypothetical protein [Chlamydiia bacterium]MCH9623884.1 hypothetical protein [Chlamydiia bacterium]
MGEIKNTIFVFTLVTMTYIFGEKPFIDETTLSGNVRAAYITREFGKVPRKEAPNVPSATAVAANKKNFFCSASYTLWTANQGGMNIATSNTSQPPFTNSAGNTIAPISSVRSGFKITAGKNLFFDGWIALISYTWFNNPANFDSSSYIAGNSYRSPWIIEDYINLTAISDNFSNQFNRINSKLYRRLKFSPSFIFTPWIGLQGAWEDQYLDANITIEKTLLSSSLLTMRNLQYWWCIGPYAGTEITYTTVKNIIFFINSGAGLNLAKHDVFLKQEMAPTSSPNEKTTTQDLPMYSWNTEAMFESSLGVAIHHNFGDVSCFLKASWEIQIWMNHNGFISPYDGTGIYGDYSTQGLTISAGAIF